MNYLNTADLKSIFFHNLFKNRCFKIKSIQIVKKTNLFCCKPGIFCRFLLFPYPPPLLLLSSSSISSCLLPFPSPVFLSFFPLNNDMPRHVKNSYSFYQIIAKMTIQFCLVVILTTGLLVGSVQMKKCKYVDDIASKFYDLGPKFSDEYLTAYLHMTGIKKVTITYRFLHET